MDWSAVIASLREATGVTSTGWRAEPMGGGCINRTYRLMRGEHKFFVKLNGSDRRDWFEAEADGLRALGAARCLRVPLPVCVGSDATHAWLVLEWLELGGRSDSAAMGHGLAGLHRVTVARFGWHRDNAIGATAQLNGWSDDWPAFWRERRLRPQLELAARNGWHGRLQRDGIRVLERLGTLFDGNCPPGSLLHGDLWSGNAAYTAHGEPVVFDPAVYCGDRETDLAMTELFGGFDARFQAAYCEAWPLDAGYAVRRDLYNLYHVLNHLNLFGGRYLKQAESLIGRLLAPLHP
jgi:fructosamine-3-kinase